MNKRLKLVYDVAIWEFSRWFKLKEQIITIIVFSFISLLIFGGISVYNKYFNSKKVIAVINNSELVIEKLNSAKYTFRTDDSLSKNYKEQLKSKKVDAILYIFNLDTIKIYTQSNRNWVNELIKELTDQRSEIKIKQSNITNEAINNIFNIPFIKTIYTENDDSKISSGEKIAAGILIGMMLMGIFLGLAYQFTAITGEKQLRITEVIVSAISPQTWIDGKIIGISLLSFSLLITYSLSTVIFVIISALFDSGWTIPLDFGNPKILFILTIFAFLGFIFWNTFFSAIAATINDPNTSARGSLIMLPILNIVLAFFAFGNPDSLLIRLLSMFPPTSSPILAVRLILTDVSIIEIAISFILLVFTIYFLRKAAGKIFEVSILMYGKELSWSEIKRCITIDKTM
ncbi:MAG TPA: ABC transporter permease [Melioribacteraceae bacterium]|nr:ABC transporter permease [Melioribacteraceae bacterium]